VFRNSGIIPSPGGQMPGINEYADNISGIYIFLREEFIRTVNYYYYQENVIFFLEIRIIFF